MVHCVDVYMKAVRFLSLSVCTIARYLLSMKHHTLCKLSVCAVNVTNYSSVVIVNDLLIPLLL